MTWAILDASALLAVIFEEDGADMVAAALREGAAMSSVNAAEVASCPFQRGWTGDEVVMAFSQLGVDVLPFDTGAAIASGSFRPTTRQFGLGLGDRACLATALQQNCPALTADRVWLTLDHPRVEIRCIR